MKGLLHSKPLLRTLGLVLVAYFASELVYWRLVVPRLTQVRHVPLAWWIGVYAPFGLAAMAAGALLSAKREIPRHACVAASIPLGVPFAWSLLSGAWAGRDTGVGDLIGWNPSLWGILVVGFAIMAAIFAAAIALGYFATARRRASRT
jgi:hypothetical protein